ncbi:hypothetical protein J2Z65_002800 [Paenibacillus aceris]|uniref:Uncharacterized protein n=1 Tax=Paenibacillus aceris TaxID=869555 RepID=A0ABS4HZ64_9BACL|nr:hypothetical protein [Paenibacillus aceris]
MRCCNDVFHRCSRGFPREQRLILKKGVQSRNSTLDTLSSISISNS